MSNGKRRRVTLDLCVAAILCLAICSCVAEKQTISRDQQQVVKSQSTPLPEELPIPRGPFKHGFQVETKYDKFRDQTRVSLDCKVYYKGPFGLFLAVEGSYPQQSPSPPETVQFGLTAMSSKEKYTKSRHLIILADGQRFDLGELDRDLDKVEDLYLRKDDEDCTFWNGFANG